MRKIVFAMSLLAAASSAQAGCYKSTAAGAWQTFVAEDYVWSSCKINVNGKGNVTSGSCTGSYGSLPVTGGKISTSWGCEVTGHIYVDGELNQIKAARASIDRNTINGSVELGGQYTTFTAVRY